MAPRGKQLQIDDDKAKDIVLNWLEEISVYPVKSVCHLQGYDGRENVEQRLAHSIYNFLQ